MRFAVLLLIVLSTDVAADDAYVLQHDRSRRLDFLETKRCGDDLYAYLVTNAQVIEAIEVVVGDELELALKFRGVADRRSLTRRLGLRGFLDVSAYHSFYVAFDPEARQVTVALIRRKGADVCAERLVSPVVPRT